MAEFWQSVGEMVNYVLRTGHVDVPLMRVLLVGMVSCWNVDGKTRPTSTFSGSSQHNAPITVIKWNPAGKRLITGDKVDNTLLHA